MNTESVTAILNNPAAHTLNMTLHHGMITGIAGVKPLTTLKSARPDAYWSGKMKSRNVPRRSRRPANVQMSSMSHIVSDIGVVPVADRYGHKFFVMYKCLYTQYRVVHRLKQKDHIVHSWKKFITDHALQERTGSMKIRVRFLVTDDDKSYVHGKIKEMNQTNMIANWAIAPYTHNANPAESEMRRIMENAVCALYSSGLPPSFLLDALEYGCTCSNMLYTSVHHESEHEFKSPWERVKGSKPNINNVARFGSKTYVFINKDERAKGSTHSWVGWYLGVSDNMLASRVYRPLTHTVYDRFHTLHDSSVVYGDFLGAMYRERVKADRDQREYFNSAVDELLNTPENQEDLTLTAMRARPWTRQPDPVDHGAERGAEEEAQVESEETESRARARAREDRDSSAAHKRARGEDESESEMPASKRRAIAEAAEELLTDGPRAGPQLTRAGRGQRTARTLAQEQASEHANAHARRVVRPPPTTPAVARWRPENNDAAGLSPADIGEQNRARYDNVDRAQARNLLGGVSAPAKFGCLAAIEVTTNFYSLLDRLVLESEDEISHDTLLALAQHELEGEEEDNEEYVALLQLCEEISRKIAHTPEPKTRREIASVLARNDIEAKLLKEAMLEEVVWMVSNHKAKPKSKLNVDRLHEIDGKWVIKYKKTLTGLLDRVRARWVLRGDKQRAYKDYDPHKLYAPVASKTTNLSVLTVAVQHGLMLYTIDVSKAFTISAIEMDNVHMRVPDFFDSDVHPDYAPWGTDTTWELLTSLYGLRQASARYYDKISNDIVRPYRDSQGRQFRRNGYDPCCFTKGELVRGFDKDGKPNTKDYTCFSMHVDDKFVAVSSVSQLDDFKEMLDSHGVKYTLDPLTHMLGMRIRYTRHEPNECKAGKLVIDHDQYVTDSFNSIKKHELIDQSRTSNLNIPISDVDRKRLADQEEPVFCKERYRLFRAVLGKVQHCSQYTHPEITTAVSIVSQHMMNPSQLDVDCAFGILRYLNGTVGNERAQMTIQHDARFDKQEFTQNPSHMLSDADLSNCPLTRRSRTGWSNYLYFNLTGWKSQKQTQVSLSTCESEYVALSSCAQFAKWYRGLLADMGVLMAYCEPIVILTDSQSATNLATKTMTPANKYSRHIQQRVCWLRELIQDGSVRLAFTPGDQNIADIFTKVLANAKFKQFCDELLHGDRRVFRETANLVCMMQYRSDMPNQTLSIPARACTCHAANFLCISTHESPALLHHAHDLD